MHIKCLRQLLSGVCALVLSLIAASTALGQGVTTAGMTGFVKNAQGDPVAGASVVAVHQPSGTRYTGVTRSNGEYDFAGMRTGGPYTVTVTGNGFATQTQENKYLSVGETAEVDFSVSNEVVTMEAVNVAGVQDPTFDSGAMGTATVFNSEQVMQTASRAQDIADVINLDPRAVVMQAGTTDQEDTISIQGQNPRENLILVDGVSATDNFGLNSNSYAGLRNPIPFDWIENFGVLINDYDEIYSGFEGGAIDITLKSGTNDFHGSLYGYYEGTKFRGPDPVASLLGSHEEVQNHETGGTFSGPIIKDKLFFFVGYDAFREIAAPPAQAFNPTDNSADTAVVNQILAQATALGYQPGSFNAINHTWQQNFVAKLDWNINDAQKFEFTFRHTAGEAPIFYMYTGSTETSLSGSWYNSYRTDQSYTAKLNSDWSQFIPGLSTEIEATYKRYNGTATYDGPDLPAVTIENLAGTETTLAGTSSITSGKLFLGRYYAYQLNNIYTWEQEQHAYAQYSVGAHTFKFGVSFDRTAYTDTFIPNYLGSYYFANVTDFLNATPTYVNLETPANGYTLGSDVSHYYLLDAAPLLEDTYTPNTQLTILAGLRLDYPYEPQRPDFSQIFYNAWGFPNNTTMNGNTTISPRIAFNYTLPTEQKTQVRGGAGLFLGTNPVVWVENDFNNAGQLNNYSVGSSSATAAPISSSYKFNPSNQGLPPAAPGSAVPGFDTTASNFHWPANWKENLAIDHTLPFAGIILTAEVDLSQVEKDAMYQALNIAPATSGPAFMPDGAIRYAGNVTSGVSGDPDSPGSSFTPALHSGTGQVYELTNTDKGGSQEYTLELHTPFQHDWQFMVAYTHTHATAVDYLGSSVASSNFEDQYFVNPNDNVPYRSQFSVPDKVILTATKRFHFFPWQNTATTISAQFIAQTGQAYSYVFNGDADGSGFSDQSLFYVPAGPSDPKVTWESATEETNFFNWLASNPALEKYEGQVAPRNAFYAPWQKTINLHFEQQVGGYGPAKVTLFADIVNFANLLDRNWGVVADYDPNFSEIEVAGTDFNAAGNGGAGQYIYRFNSSTLSPSITGPGGGLQTSPTIYSDLSRYQIDVGARIDF